LSGGCAKDTAASDFCLTYTPVYPDYSADTAETIRQVNWNNAVFLETCESEFLPL
jgi:hypothetical protein